MIRALFVDASLVARRRAEQYLAPICELDCVSTAGEALKLISCKEYQLFLFEYSSKTGAGLELARAVRAMEIYEETPIFLFSSSLTDSLAYAAAKAKVNQCLNKSTPQEVVLKAIEDQLQTPRILAAELNRLETKCIEWREGNMFYEYSPELRMITSGVSKEEAHLRMDRALQDAYDQRKTVNIFSDDVELCLHGIRLTPR